MTTLRQYRRAWAVDFEFHAPPGERPTPICVVARELRTGEQLRTWLANGASSTPPYDAGPDALEEIPATHRLAGALHESEEEIELPTTQGNGLVVP